MPQPPSRLETLLQGHAAARIAGADEAGADRCVATCLPLR